MDRKTALDQDRIFWAQRPNNNTFNDGEYKLRLLNDKVVAVGDTVVVEFSNGNFRGRVKQIAGFGMHEERAVISVVFPGKSSGKKVSIDNVIDKA
jgi:predicted HAD superfamily phosphohydrolase YqeG